MSGSGLAEPTVATAKITVHIGGYPALFSVCGVSGGNVSGSVRHPARLVRFVMGGRGGCHRDW